MATLVEKRYFTLTDQSSGKNNNKFWSIEEYDNGDTQVQYGRQGETGQSQTKYHGDAGSANKFAEKMIRSKTKKGYHQVEVIGSGAAVRSTAKAVTNSSLESIAQNQIRSNNPIVSGLITQLTRDNAHQIHAATGGQITFNDATGLFQTSMGIVGQSSIDMANDVLVQIGDLVANGSYGKKFDKLSNEYFMAVPQSFGRRGFEIKEFWHDLAVVQKQKAIVDALEASLVSATSNPTTKTAIKLPQEQVFDVQLDLVEDDKILKMVKKMYGGTKQQVHACQHLDVKRVYSVDINTVSSSFKQDGAKLKNIWQLWHGTRSSNLLSILKGGLIIPPSSSSHCTGRMFGNGIYASDQSTKALNYAYGYWGSKRKDDNCFMFLLDMAMGDYHVPNGPSRNFPVKGTQSTFAKARQSGVGNNEMIVYKTNQVNLKYLVEFSPQGK